MGTSNLWLRKIRFGQVLTILIIMLFSLISVPIQTRIRLITIDRGETENKARLVSTSTTIRLMGQVGGSLSSVVVQGIYAYVGVGMRLIILDISNPVIPREVGVSVPLNGLVKDIKVVDSIAYVVSSEGLWIFNVSDPTYPTKIGFYETPGFAEGITVVGHNVYVADGWAGLCIIDISNPKNPVGAGFAHTPGYALDVIVNKDVTYIAAAGAGLRIVDVSNPASPVEVGFYDTPGYAYSVAVAGRFAYIADAWKGVRIIDVSDPTSPIEVGFYDTLGWAFDLAIEGSIVYVADAFKGLRILDVSLPSSPREVGACEVKGHVEKLFIAGGKVYVVDRNNGLRIIDISSLFSPTQIGLYSPLGYADAIVVSGNYAYVAAGFQGLRIVDVSDPARPLEIGFYDTQGYATSVSVVGNYAYVITTPSGGAEDGIHIIDISNPRKPTKAGFYRRERRGAYWDLVVLGGIAYCVDENGLLLVNVSNPISPFETGYIHLSALPEEWICTTGLDVRGTLAYVAVNEWGVRIVDISDPQNPTLIGTFMDESFYALDVTVVGDRIYVAGTDKGLWLLNASNPTSPTKIGVLKIRGSVLHVAVNGSIACAAIGKNGILLINVSNPSKPSIIAEYDTPGYSNAVAIKNNLIYVADGSTGLLILEIDPLNHLNEQAFHRSNEFFIRYPRIVRHHVLSRTWQSTRLNQTVKIPSLAINVYNNSSSTSNILVVNTTADSGPGSLRWCIKNAHSGDTITFDQSIFPPDDPATITLYSELPSITQGNITIDASDAGVILNGRNLPEGSTGIKIASDGNIVRGLQILNFPSQGIEITGNGNIIGGDRRVGKGPIGQGNVISGNSYGIRIHGDKNIIIGNLIGTDSSGTVALINREVGVSVLGRNNRIGGYESWERNIIVGIYSGVGLGFGASGNSVIGNYIGTDITGSRVLVRGEDGVGIETGAFNNLVRGNLINGYGAGITIWDYGTSYNVIIGNIIGLDAACTKALGNDVGIIVGGGAIFNRIGGTTLEERNIIGGNNVGIGLGSDNNFVIGNFIGVNLTNTKIICNSIGISIGGSNHNFIEGNVVVGENSVGIKIQEGCNYNYVIENHIKGVYTGIGIYGRSTKNYIGYNRLLPGPIEHLWIGILLDENSNYNVLVGNQIRGRGCTAFQISTKNNLIEDNYVCDARFGVIIAYSSGNIVANNIFSRIYEQDAVLIYQSSENYIVGNNISSSLRSITLSNFANKNVVKSNIISASKQGIFINSSSDNNLIMNNEVSGNELGIIIHRSSDNRIYNNNFVRNTRQGYDDSENNWNFKRRGNYWSDYTGIDLHSGPYQNETGSDGIGDIPYTIDEDTQDQYPLMGPIRIFDAGIWSGRVQEIYVASNSTIFSFQLNRIEKKIIFSITGVKDTIGFCIVTLPNIIIQEMWNSSYAVLVDGRKVDINTWTDKENTYVYFAYKHYGYKLIVLQASNAILQVIAVPGGTTDPLPDIYKYPVGKSVKITAIPDKGYSFDYWLLDGKLKKDNPILIVMDRNHKLEAVFTDNIPPVIDTPLQKPAENVQPHQKVVVTVKVIDYGTGVCNVTLWYSIDNGTTWMSVNMSEISSDTYRAVIPGFKDYVKVAYKITAYDNAGNSAINDNQSSYYRYHVTAKKSFIETPLGIVTLLGGIIAIILVIVLIISRKNRFRSRI